MSWLKTETGANSGVLPEFSNVEAGQVMGLPASNARHRGFIQSRIDFACYKCGLPPLGLAADEPYKKAWRSTDTGWEFPVPHMALAVRSRRWTDDDFKKLDAVLCVLRSGATKLWKDEIALNSEKIHEWAYGFVGLQTPLITAVATQNPVWSRDELILALRLYMRHRSSPPSKGSVEVALLSRLLRTMNLRSSKSATFRNTDGVYMKLMNLRSIDPDYLSQNKVGLKKRGKDEQRVWDLYVNDIPGLEAAADAISLAISAPTSETGIDQPDEDDIEECEEGRVLTRLHRYRERNRKLVSDFKDWFRKRNGGKLICAGCGLDCEVKYGAMAERLIDVHHTKPVHTMKPAEKTHPNDLVLLCVSCHRAVHSRRRWLTVDELKSMLATIAASGVAKC